MRLLASGGKWVCSGSKRMRMTLRTSWTSPQPHQPTTRPLVSAIPPPRQLGDTPSLREQFAGIRGWGREGDGGRSLAQAPSPLEYVCAESVYTNFVCIRSVWAESMHTAGICQPMCVPDNMLHVSVASHRCLFLPQIPALTWDAGSWWSGTCPRSCQLCATTSGTGW